VELAAAVEREPGASARTERLGLLELFQSQQLAEEAPSLGLAVRRRGELDVI
jgi:hypothetical protein